MLTMARFKRNLHPSDFSPASAGAFAKALQLAKDNRAELVLLHVLGSPLAVVEDGYVSPSLYEQIETSRRAGAKRQLDKLVARAKKAGVRGRELLIEGSPYDRITRVARSHRGLDCDRHPRPHRAGQAAHG
jgi:nucleotide-binding universal stress UspA family protein